MAHRSQRKPAAAKSRHSRTRRTPLRPPYAGREFVPEPLRDPFMPAFAELWRELFASPLHLDSALSKRKGELKALLAQSLPALLLKPVSLAQALGVEVAADEPWNLTLEQKARWPVVFDIAEQVRERLARARQGEALADVAPLAADFPPALLQQWEHDWGADTARQLVDVLGREAPLSLRVVQAVGTAPVIEQLQRYEASQVAYPVDFKASKFAPNGLSLSAYLPVLRSELFEQGAFEIQDEGSQVMALFALAPEVIAPLLQPKPGPVHVPDDWTWDWKAWKARIKTGLTVVDACAGAGGKTLALADAVEGKGRMFAYDASARKLLALKKSAKRAGFNNIQTVAIEDGAELAVVSRFAKSADVVLVDAPCSGQGVLRRNPDIKWRQDAAVLQRMPEIQLRLLDAYAQLLKPSGRLVFGVCTFRPEETTLVVERFLQTHPEFEAREGGYLGPGPCDGFYMQAFVRQG